MHKFIYNILIEEFKALLRGSGFVIFSSGFNSFLVRITHSI